MDTHTFFIDWCKRKDLVAKSTDEICFVNIKKFNKAARKAKRFMFPASTVKLLGFGFIPASESVKDLFIIFESDDLALGHNIFAFPIEISKN